MFLFNLLLAFIGFSQLAISSPPKKPFRELLDTCINPKNSNSKVCEYFFSTYTWQNDDISLVFQKLALTKRTRRSSALNRLEERLIRLIGNPNFDLTTLGEGSFYLAVTSESETLAMAIWPQLEKYRNHSMEFYFANVPEYYYSDLQLFECSQSLGRIIDSTMLQLLKKMVSDQPKCLQQRSTIKIPLGTGSSIAMREFLDDHGVEILPSHIENKWISPEGFEWALLKYRHSNDLIKNSTRDGNEDIAIAIWEFLKQKNYNDLLFTIWNNTAFDVVSKNKFQLLNTMLRGCPECIHLNGNTLMDIALSRSLPMVQLLNLYGVEIPPGHNKNIEGTSYIFQAILDYGLQLTEVESTEGTHIMYNGAWLPRREDDVINVYFKKAIEDNRNDLCIKSLGHSTSGISLPKCYGIIY